MKNRAKTAKLPATTIIRILSKILRRLAKASLAAARTLVGRNREEAEVNSFLVKLKKFGDFPVMIHVEAGGRVRMEFLPGFHQDEEIVAEVNRIITSDAGEEY